MTYRKKKPQSRSPFTPITNERFETGHVAPAKIPLWRRQCTLPHERVLRPGEGTITVQEFWRRVA